MTQFRFSLRILFWLTAWLALSMGVVSAGYRTGGVDLAIWLAVLILLSGVLGLLLIPNIRGAFLGSIVTAGGFGIGLTADLLSRWCHS